MYATADSPVPPGAEWIIAEWQKALLAGEKTILILDEIQKVKGWSETIKELYDKERRKEIPLQVILLGSASWHIQSGLSETLSGRYELIRVPHWSFEEHIKLSNWNLDQYLQFGGYPAPAAIIDEPKRWMQLLRDSIIEPVLSRDLLSLKQISKPALFRQTLELICRHPAQEISLQKLLGQLQDSGNTTTIRGYIELLEAGFIIKSLPKFSTRAITLKSSSPKLIPLCPALVHAFESPSRLLNDPEWKGRVFEAAIGACLVNNFSEVFYWREDNREIDFVIKLDNLILGIEIKSGRKKNLKGTKAFLDAFKGAQCVTIDLETGEALLKSKDPKKFLLKAI